nr:ABC transporter ATP-binding protein [Acidithrix ferrooxidans]
MTTALVTSVLGMLIQVVIPLLERQIIDSTMVVHKYSPAGLAIGIIILALGAFGLSFLRRYFGGRLAFDVQHDIRSRIFSHLQRLDFARHDQLQSGQLVSRANSDVGLIQGLLSFLPLMFGNLFMLVVSLGVMFYLSPILGLIEFCAIPLLGSVAYRLRAKVFPAVYDAQVKEGEVAVVVEESISGVRVVKGFGREKARLAELSRAALALFRSSVRVDKIEARLQSSLSSLPGLIQALVLLVGGYLGLHHEMTIGTFLVFFSYIVQIGAPIRQVSVLVTFSQQAKAGAERIFELLDANPLVKDAEFPSEMPLLPATIAFSDAYFEYQPGNPVLKGLSLEVEGGSVTAFVGLSGSGKSTLALLLPRFYDLNRGSIAIGGVDIKELSIAQLRKKIGVVFEESFLFSDTIAKNIAFGYPDATLEEIRIAAERAGALSFIEGLSNGFDTVVGEYGITLSGGQRQRVALARALITDPDILILDDATSSVDVTTEAEINQALREFAKGRTVLVIAHRRSTLSLAQRIVVLDSGRVEDSGSHSELIDRSAIYRKLISAEGDEISEGDEELTTTLSGSTTKAPSTPLAQSQGFRLARGGRGGGGGPRDAALSLTPGLAQALNSLPAEEMTPDVDEELVTKDVDHFAFWRFISPFRWKLLASFAFLLADTILSLAGPYAIKTGIDKGVVGGSLSMIVLVSIFYVFVVLCDWGAVYMQNILSNITTERILYGLRLRIFSHLQRLGLSFYESEMSGRILTRMTTDVVALSNLLQSGLTGALVNLFSFVAISIVMLVIDPRLALAALYVLIPLAIATVWFQRRSTRAYRVSREKIAAVNANLQEGISGVRVTQAFSREAQNAKEFNRVSQGYRDSRVKAQRLVAIYFPFVLFLSDLASTSVLWYGSNLVNAKVISVGAVIAFTLYIDQLFAPLQQLSQTFDQFQQARVSLVQVDRLLNMPTTTPASLTPIKPLIDSGEIVFEDVGFSYDGSDRNVIEAISMHIKGGDTVALVGETGAGKSTIVKLIARLYDPTDGRILIDGQPLKDLDLDDFRSHLGYVPQEAFLFSGTIASNISFARPQASFEEIKEAATAVGADSFIDKIPGGYSYEVSERGRALSSGQRQLIALARAYLARPKILILDEATANLDLSSERKVTQAMGVVASGRTCILIAHRLQSAALADRIFVIGDGRLLEEGSHDELLRNDSVYASLWRESNDSSTSRIA